MNYLKTIHFKIPQRIFRLESLRSKFILSFIVLSIIPMILLAYISYRASFGILQHNVQSYSSELIDRVDRSLEMYLSDLERILDLRNDYYNVQFIKLSLAGDIEGNRKYTFRLWENLNNLKKLKTDLQDVAVTTLTGVTVSCYGVTHNDVSQDELFKTLANNTIKNDKMAIWGPHPNWLGENVFTVGRAIRGDLDNFLGIMSIDVDVRLFERICKDIRLGKTGYVMLIDGDGKIIYHPKPEFIGKPLDFLLGNSIADAWKSGSYFARVGTGTQVITVKTFVAANWKIIGLSNKAELTAEMQKINGITLALIILTIVVLTIAAVFLASLLYKPIKELQQSMWRASEDLNTNVQIHTHDEIGQLGESFNQMLGRIRELMDQCVLEQKKLRRTEMKALQEQIKPHFIYNTLDLIIGLLETNKNDDVINMVEALGMFFRLSLNQGQEYITFREEIEHVRNYLYLQRFRHGDKYDYVFEVDQRLLEYKTIKLILQPLVENAIYHGVRPLNSPGGLITVKGYLENDQVCFEVLDNGVGMEESKLEEINHCFAKDSNESKDFNEYKESSSEPQHYFGLRNVHERIVLAFGKEYGLHLEPNLGGGIRVIGRLPLM